MDRYMWLKYTTLLSTVCAALNINNRIIFFDGHDSNFDERALIYMGDQNTQPFVLKAGNDGNDLTNNNSPNEKQSLIKTIQRRTGF